MTDSIERFFAQLRDEADTSHFMDLATPAIEAGSRVSPWARIRNRAATVTTSIILAFSGLTGVAIAANGSAPGDLLYPIDTAFEWVGLGNGGPGERLAEIRSLIDEGEVGVGLEHAADNLVTDAEARTALREAALRIADTDAPTGVSELLTYLSEEIDAVEGPVVADLARQIGGPPDDAPGGPPETTPPTGPTPQGPPDGPPAGPPQTP